MLLENSQYALHFLMPIHCISVIKSVLKQGIKYSYSGAELLGFEY